jgi:hypothetical protein
MTAPPHGGTAGISIDDRFSESHYFPHTNENSASQGRFSRFAEVGCFARYAAASPSRRKWREERATIEATAKRFL